MKNDPDAEQYTELFLEFSDGVERFLRRMIACLLLALFVCQIALSIPAVRGVLASADRFEGVLIQDIGSR